MPPAVKLGIYAGIFALIAVIFSFTYHEGARAGRLAVQVQWDADKAAQQRAADAAIAKATQEKLAAIAANEVISDQYLSAIANSDARAAEYAQRLRDYEARLHAAGSAAGKAPGNADPPAAAPASGQGQLESAIGQRLVECDANEAQLIALQEELLPQL